MVEERGYTSQVAPGGPGRAVLVDADVYGAGLGRAAEQAGDQQHQRALRSYRLDRQEAADAEAADVQRRAAEARVRIDQKIRESRTGPVPGAKGHAEAIRAALEEEKTKLLEGVAEDSIRRSASTNWDEYASRTFSNEDGYELGRRVDLDIANHNRAGEIGVNRITSSGGDKATYQEELIQGYASIDALQNVTPEEKDKLKRAHEAGMTTAWLAARNETDPAGVKLELGAGLYDDLLTPDQVKALDRGADIEIKAKAVAAEAAAVEARTQARNAVEALEARTEAGDIPSAKETAQVIAAARAAGVPEADLIRFTTKRDDAQILRTYNPANDPTGTKSAATVEAIDAKIRAGTATPEEYRLRDTLAGYGDKRATDSAAELKELAATGPAGQLQAVETIGRLASRAERFEAGRKLGGNLGYVALLPSSAARAVAINGAGVLKARPKDFGEKVDVEESFRRIIGPIAPALGSGFGDLQSLAWQIYAGQMNDKGLSGWDKRNFDTAVRSAFGATSRRDGTMQGGIGTVRGRPVILPDNLTASEFDARISRADYSGAAYADGSQASKADVLARFRPEWHDSDATGANYYRMIGPGGKPLRMKDGRLFNLKVTR